MKHLAWMLITFMLLTSLAGCIVRTGPRHRQHHSHSKARSCPPSYHWNGRKCVHNSNRGRGKGPPVRDHRRGGGWR